MCKRAISKGKERLPNLPSTIFEGTCVRLFGEYIIYIYMRILHSRKPTAGTRNLASGEEILFNDEIFGCPCLFSEEYLLAVGGFPPKSF